MERPKLSRDDWFKLVSEVSNDDWNRRSDGDLVLWFKDWGSARDAEVKLMANRGMAIQIEVDRLCGKIFMVVKEPKHIRGIQ